MTFRPELIDELLKEYVRSSSDRQLVTWVVIVRIPAAFSFSNT
jgi:hypothetical protein